jgi:hypothetical protein
MKVRTSNWLFGIMMIIIVGISLLTTSCAQTCQRIKANGSIIGTVSGPWVVIKQSGGIITDVFLLDDALVKSEAGSDGWIFTNKDGNVVHLGGDMKAIRCSNDKLEVFSRYVEYHQDIDRCSYFEKYNKVNGLTTASMDIQPTMVIPTK